MHIFGRLYFFMEFGNFHNSRSYVMNKTIAKQLKDNKIITFKKFEVIIMAMQCKTNK